MKIATVAWFPYPYCSRSFDAASSRPPAAEVVLDTVFCLEDAIDTRIAILVSLDYTRKQASDDPVVLNLLNRLKFS